MTDLFTLNNTALVTKLKADVGITADGGRVYELPAPEGKAYPLYTFQVMAGGDLNDSKRRAVDIVLLIECWHTELGRARAGAGYIDRALHNQELTASGWSNWRTQSEQVRSASELVAGELVYRVGAIYRISWASNT